VIKNELIFNNSLQRIDKLKCESKEIEDLFDALSKIGDIIIVGGALRDFALDDAPRDIDIIIDSDSPEDFNDALKEFDCYRNRFGGYKLIISSIEFDIWSINDNWAFKEGIHNSKFSNISKGTFYNFDAIALNLTTLQLDADIFIQTLNNKMLDITLEEDFIPLNPTPEVNIVRAFNIREEWGLNFSNRVSRYISEWFETTASPYEVLQKAELKHYGRTTDQNKYRLSL